MQYDVIIIGAGPGGIFSAYELSKLCPDKKIAVFEEGSRSKSADVPSTARPSSTASAARPARS